MHLDCCIFPLNSSELGVNCMPQSTPKLSLKIMAQMFGLYYKLLYLWCEKGGAHPFLLNEWFIM